MGEVCGIHVLFKAFIHCAFISLFLLGFSIAMSMENYEIIKKLGQGSFGTCYLAKRKDNMKLYAIKQMSGFTTKVALQQFTQEIDLHRQMDHDNIVRFREAFQDRLWPSDAAALTASLSFRENRKIVIVMDYCDGG